MSMLVLCCYYALLLGVLLGTSDALGPVNDELDNNDVAEALTDPDCTAYTTWISVNQTVPSFCEGRNTTGCWNELNSMSSVDIGASRSQCITKEGVNSDTCDVVETYCTKCECSTLDCYSEYMATAFDDLGGLSKCRILFSKRCFETVALYDTLCTKMWSDMREKVPGAVPYQCTNSSTCAGGTISRPVWSTLGLLVGMVILISLR